MPWECGDRRKAASGSTNGIPISFTFLEFIGIFSPIYKELFGNATSENASASKASLCVCLH